MRDALGRPQSVLLLGGTSDIGLAITRRLVARGASRVVLAGRDTDALAEAGLALPGATVEVEAFDARDTESHEAFVAKVFAGGDVDVVVLAFGLHARTDQVTDDPERGVAIAEVNYTGATSVLLRVAPALVEQGHGRLVVMSSVAAERVRKDNYAYGASKAGLDGFAQGLGDSLRGTGVEVCVVRPGFVHSKMTADHTPAPFATTPERVADDVITGLDAGRHTVWSPPILRWLFVVLRHLPRAIFRQLKPS